MTGEETKSEISKSVDKHYMDCIDNILKDTECGNGLKLALYDNRLTVNNLLANHTLKDAVRFAIQMYSAGVNNYKRCVKGD